MSLELLGIILFSVWGSGLTSYHLGRRAGIEDAVQHLAKEGIIELGDE
tara:strand:+ start:759 stop:902 length:144 start_codon:yes stop_codon:yes gene_type:complete